MKLTPLQERLIAAYQHPVVGEAVTPKPNAAPTPARDADRLELSPQAAAAQRIQSRLVGGRVSQAAVPEEPGTTRIAPDGAAALALHRTHAAVNAAATGVAAGAKLDTVG
jgi:hypothetical protein